MCDVIAIAGTAVAVSAAGTAMSYAQQDAASNKQKTYNRTVSAQNEQYRLDTMQYQNDVWQDDIKYSQDMLAWAESEWNRQVEYAGRATKAIEKNTLAATGQLLIRQVEEDMAVIAQGFDTRRTGNVARAQIEARDRGVEGSSVEAIINDVTRQEGEALNVMAMNRSSSIRDINNALIAADAQGDQQLASISLKTYAPSQTIRTPTPVSPVNPQAPVAGANVGQLVTGMAGAVQSGFSNYNSMTQQDGATTLNQMGSWVGRQFQVTPSP
ncbi:hypothetical protein MHZ93_23340 [Roseomonas sp. ACRSG]|nr:hypothetical protein [Roseomonas sp. ACRSG]